jgi:hypothetical protein
MRLFFRSRALDLTLGAGSPGLLLPVALPWRSCRELVQRQVLDFISGRTRTRTWDPLIKSERFYVCKAFPRIASNCTVHQKTSIP